MANFVSDASARPDSKLSFALHFLWNCYQVPKEAVADPLPKHLLFG